jgi:hypothetical protein
MLAPLDALGDAARDEALRAIRDQAAAIHEWVGSAERPAWLDANPHDSARAAGEALGQRQRERFQEGLPTVSACRDLGQLCPSGIPPEIGASEDPAIGTVPVRQAVEQGKEEGSTATPLRAEDMRLTVLVSRSLGSSQLKEIFAFAADIRRVRVAFRGVAENESLMDFVRQVHGLLAEIEPVPEVVLDSTPFAAAGMDIAPVLLAQGRTASWHAWRVSRIRSGCGRAYWPESAGTWGCWGR